eukprot:1319201-Pyramimonas_sp.AAC.1
MRAVPLRLSVGRPMGHETLSWAWVTHVATPTWALGGAPDGTTRGCTGCGGRMWPSPTGAADGVPYGARKSCTGFGGRMCPPPLGPHTDLPMGPRGAVLGVADA